MCSPAYPSSSNDPAPLTAIKGAYCRACDALSRLWSHIKLVTHKISPTTSNLNSISRVRFITVSRCIRSRGAHHDEFGSFPLYLKPLEIEMQNHQQLQTRGTTLKKMTLSLTFQAVVALALSLQNSWSSPSHLLTLHAVQSVMVMAFAVSFGASYLRHVYPRLANAFENIGSVVAENGLCLMTSFFTWVSWLACALCILAFLISFTK